MNPKYISLPRKIHVKGRFRLLIRLESHSPLSSNDQIFSWTSFFSGCFSIVSTFSWLPTTVVFMYAVEHKNCAPLLCVSLSKLRDQTLAEVYHSQFCAKKQTKFFQSTGIWKKNNPQRKTQQQQKQRQQLLWH